MNTRSAYFLLLLPGLHGACWWDPYIPPFDSLDDSGPDLSSTSGPDATTDVPTTDATTGPDATTDVPTTDATTGPDATTYVPTTDATTGPDVCVGLPEPRPVASGDEARVCGLHLDAANETLMVFGETIIGGKRELFLTSYTLQGEQLDKKAVPDSVGCERGVFADDGIAAISAASTLVRKFDLELKVLNSYEAPCAPASLVAHGDRIAVVGKCVDTIHTALLEQSDLVVSQYGDLPAAFGEEREVHEVRAIARDSDGRIYIAGSVVVPSEPVPDADGFVGRLDTKLGAFEGDPVLIETTGADVSTALILHGDELFAAGYSNTSTLWFRGFDVSDDMMVPGFTNDTSVPASEGDATPIVEALAVTADRLVFAGYWFVDGDSTDHPFLGSADLESGGDLEWVDLGIADASMQALAVAECGFYAAGQDRGIDESAQLDGHDLMLMGPADTFVSSLLKL